VTTRAVPGRFWQAQGVKDVEWLRGAFAQALEAALPGVGGVFLDARQEIERGAGAGGVALGFQAQAHDAPEHEGEGEGEGEGEEADQGVSADAIRQAVVDGGDLDVGFQHAE